MEIVEILNVSQDEFFDYIEQALKEDLKNQGIEATVKNKMTYQKRMRKDNNKDHDEIMNVYIDEFDRNGIYQSHFSLNDIEYTIAYKIKNSTKNTIEVAYKEEYKRLSKMPKIISFILPHKVVKNSKRRMKATLKMIEKNITESRKGKHE